MDEAGSKRYAGIWSDLVTGLVARPGREGFRALDPFDLLGRGPLGSAFRAYSRTVGSPAGSPAERLFRSTIGFPDSGSLVFKTGRAL